MNICVYAYILLLGTNVMYALYVNIYVWLYMCACVSDITKCYEEIKEGLKSQVTFEQGHEGTKEGNRVGIHGRTLQVEGKRVPRS